VRPDAAKPKGVGKTSLEEQAKLFRKIEAERARIARVMLRYPKLTSTIMPALTEKTRLRLFTKTAEWALVLDDLLLTQCATLDSAPSFDSWSVASREMFRIHDIGDAEMERFIAALEDRVERLLLVESHFEIQAREHGLSPRAAMRLKERDLKAEALPPDQTETLIPLIEEIERIEKEAGASSKNMKEDLATVVSARSDLQSAKKEAVEANLRLVIRIARKYFHPEVPFEDLVQEGNLGLMRAVDKFDYLRGYKFSTYANWWIKQAIARSIYAHGHIIRLPFHLVQKAGKAGRASSKGQLETGKSPATEEIAREVGISPMKLDSILQAMKRRLVSMDMPILEGEAELRDFIADPAALSPEDAVIHKDMNAELKTLLETLDPREKLILMKRFGIDGEEEQSLRELSREFGVTAERIRQIEKKAMEKVRRRLSALEAPMMR
jgi:RNA polymerase sigma factor (sigma-70 family)